MKALSIKQPWAHLIVSGRKTIELRSWNTKFRGTFLIHASLNPDRSALKFFNISERDVLRGHLIGIASLKDVKIYRTKDEFLRDNEKHLSINVPKKWPVYGFILSSVKKICPLPFKGRLGFFNVEEGIKENIKMT